MAKTKVQTPVKDFTGTAAGVEFVAGSGETDNPTALAYFKRHGYQVGDAGTPDDDSDDGVTSLNKMRIDELKAYADERSIDLGDATKKADILAVINAAESDESDDDLDDSSDDQ